MKGSGYLTILCIVAANLGSIAAQECVKGFSCNVEEDWNKTEIGLCNSHFGGFPNLETATQKLGQVHLEASMKLLMMSTRFAYWKTQRPGFQKLFETLSDSAFENGVHILKHLASRGGRLHDFKLELGEGTYEVSELEALGKALDIQRKLAEETLHLMNVATSGGSNSRDGQFAHFLAEDLGEKHTKQLNILASHVNNLGRAISIPPEKRADRSMIIYMYDTYLLG